MREFDSKAFVIHKSISNNIILEFNSILVKLEKNIMKLIDEYLTYENAIKKSIELSVIYENSKKLDNIKKVLVYHFAVKKYINNIVDKNKKRIEFLNQTIATEKIPNADYNLKQITKFMTTEKVELNEEILGLNNSELDLKEHYFYGLLLTLKRGELDVSLRNNFNILIELDDKEFALIINRFPNILNTTSPEFLIDSRLRYRLFENVIKIVELNLKMKSPYEVNELLGSPLFMKKNAKLDIEKFIVELDNLLNVKIFKYLIDRYPENQEFIKEKLKCDFESEFLPLNYRNADTGEIDEIVNQLLEYDLESILND